MNMLRSHNAAYKALKAMPGAENVAIGIVHNVFWLEPKGKGPLYFHVRRVLHSVFLTDSTVPRPLLTLTLTLTLTIDPTPLPRALACDVAGRS